MLCPVEASCSTKLDMVVIGAVRNGYRSLCTDRTVWEGVHPFRPTERYFLVFLEGFLMRRWCVVSELSFFLLPMVWGKWASPTPPITSHFIPYTPKEQIRQFRRSITDRFKPSVSQYFPSYKTVPYNQVLYSVWNILRTQFGVARKLTKYANLGVFERQI